MAIRGIHCTVLVVKHEKECHGIETSTKWTTKMIGEFEWKFEPHQKIKWELFSTGKRQIK